MPKGETMPAKTLSLILTFLLLTGCAVKRIPFNENDFAGLQIKGNKTIAGQLFLVDQLEEKQVADKAEVTLQPVTPYSNQWYEVYYLENHSIQKADSRYNQYVHRTMTNPEGNFTITGVGPGDYYLSGTVFWKAATCSGNVVQKKVPICLKVTVKESDTTVNVPLTKEFVSPTEICGLYNQTEWEKVQF
jgi:hypothetical protein